MSLEGRTVLITGGGRGIGAASAWAFAEAGATVSVAARNEAQVVAVAQALREGGHEAFAFRCDVTEPHQVRDLALSATEAMGTVGILVNNAGTARSNPLERVTIGEWRHVLGVNATATFLCTQALIGPMVERGWGRIVNVASMAGLRGAKYVSAYTAAKHAVIGFTRAIAAEFEGSGVTIHAVCPGYVDTPLTDENVARLMSRTGRTAEEALEAMLTSVGQPRLIRATEVADVIVDLCDGGRLVESGDLVVVDGLDA